MDNDNPETLDPNLTLDQMEQDVLTYISAMKRIGTEHGEIMHCYMTVAHIRQARSLAAIANSLQNGYLVVHTVNA